MSLLISTTNQNSFTYSAGKINPTCRPALACRSVLFNLVNAYHCQVNKSWQLPEKQEEMRRYSCEQIAAARCDKVPSGWSAMAG